MGQNCYRSTRKFSSQYRWYFIRHINLIPSLLKPPLNFSRLLSTKQLPKRYLPNQQHLPKRVPKNRRDKIRQIEPSSDNTPSRRIAAGHHKNLLAKPTPHHILQQSAKASRTTKIHSLLICKNIHQTNLLPFIIYKPLLE
jgi:hypothetical protein